MPVIEVYATVLGLLSYLVLPLHRCGCEFCVFLLERKETGDKPLILFSLPSALELLSAVSLKKMVWYL